MKINVWIKSGIENPSTSEVIGRSGGDEKNEWPSRKDKGRMLKKLIKIYYVYITWQCIFVHKIYEGGKSNSYCLIIRINHRSFPSLCIGENHGTVLKLTIDCYIMNSWTACIVEMSLLPYVKREVLIQQTYQICVHS